ncbi:MAG TPA: FtsX-like permease family protein, partial [Ferruginibacter sp.]|nr:FtsX-like permease family protein [Ferruginibacter sp.]
DGDEYTSGVPYPALDALRLDFPQATFAGIFAAFGSQVTVTGNDSVIQNNNKKFIEKSGLFFLEPSYFKLFDANWLNGSPSVLEQPDNVVLSKKIAEKYFTKWEDAPGQFIRLDNAITLKVAGIIEDAPENTDFPIQVAVSFETLRNSSSYGYTRDWGNNSSNHQVYMMLPNNVSSANINAQLKIFSDRNYKNKRSARINILQPLSEVHFDNRFSNFGDHITKKATLLTLSLIGLLIIIMACINFINLSTAQAVSRSKEVGVRKVLGGKRYQLFGQMMGETAVIVAFALLIAMGLAQAGLPFLKKLINLGDIRVFNTGSILFLLGIMLIVTFLSGIYPSMVLSGFKPALALKNKITSATVGRISLRRGLVVLQFAISQVLIIGTVVAIGQMNFINKADLGFDKEAILVLSGNSDSAVLARQAGFKNDLLQIPGVKTVSFNSDPPSSDNDWGTNFAFDHRDDEDYTLFLKFGDAEYLKTFGLQLIAGRGIEPSDTVREMLVNETLVNKLGIKNPNEIIGKELRTGRSTWKPIVGVVKDFKAKSLREEVKPIMLSSRKQFYSNTAIKLRSSNLKETQVAIQASWDRFYPEYVNTSSFMDENITKFYEQEDQLSILYKIFAALAIFISSLGLYGLVSFMAVQKTKEVGIRKVLGATVGNIVFLFSKEFTILITIAFIIAAPLAYFMMNKWLQDFAFRIKIGAGVFLLAVLISIIIAWLTVGYKAIKAAIANPVKSLRTE